MPIKVNDFVIQAKVEDDEVPSESSAKSLPAEQMNKFKSEILDECKDLMEEFFRKKEGR
jgi:hypothetical protein